MINISLVDSVCSLVTNCYENGELTLLQTRPVITVINTLENVTDNSDDLTLVMLIL